MFIWWNHFNTSHVTVYPRLLALKRNQNSDFNTSHVTVYLVVDNNLPKSRKFQYISCYGLSLRICSITGICRHFNTSHVTVYRNQIDPNTGLDIFQYISCYGLSERCIAMLQVLENFNTSHVTVYHEKPVEYDVKADYFNTSHVTVYQIGYVLSKCTKTISIHLMLRFIFSGTSRTCPIYINFNTSHVTVYLWNPCL
mgnify:CR=1 FL=1